jgi:hypothetical protein
VEPLSAALTADKLLDNTYRLIYKYYNVIDIQEVATFPAQAM